MKLNKKLLIGCALSGVVVIATSCGNDIRREPGKVYMPDMAESRAYETYAPHANLEEQGIHYNNQPVSGTVARGETYLFQLAKDAVGDTSNFFQSRSIPSPVTSLTEKEWDETERLYLINCGICHGAKLDGNGPLWKDGAGPFPAAPKNLVTDAGMLAMPEGQMFYSVTYGKNLMGSYASQLSPMQRWDIIHYIKAKQKGESKPAAISVATVDSTVAQ